MIDYTLALATGVDIPLELAGGCKLVLHQPTLREISMIGEIEYFTGIQTLCLNKNMFGDQLPPNVTNFQLFISVINEKQLSDKKTAVQNALTLLFPTYKILFLPRAILFKQDTLDFIIDEGNFDSLQKVLKAVGAIQGQQDEPQKLASDQARKIAEKLAKGRQRIAAQKAEKGGSMIGNYISVLAVGLKSMSLREITELTLYQLYDLIERFSLYTDWDIDIKSRLAGAKGEKPIVNWMKNLHDK